MTAALDAKEDRKARRKSGKTRAPRFNDAVFINYELDKDMLAMCKAKEMSADDVFSEMEAMITDGYKFTIKFDTYNDCFGAWCQNTDDAGANGGYILSARGSTPHKAVKQLLFKHHVCLQGEWGAYAERRTTVDLDD